MKSMAKPQFPKCVTFVGPMSDQCLVEQQVLRVMIELPQGKLKIF